MKKKYQKPTFESIILKKERLLAGSPCSQDKIPVCTTDTCSGSDVI